MNDRIYRMARLFAALAVVMLPLSACASPGPAPDADAPVAAPIEAVVEFPVTVTDDTGREVTIETEPARIVSLAPANTEILAELGLLDRIVGVTSYDDYPAEVADIEVVGDFVGPNLEAVAAADPDLVVATGGVQGDVIIQLEELGATVIAVDPADLEGLFDSIEMLGAATGTAQQASDLTVSMRADLEAVSAALGDVEPVRCFIEIAQNPLFTAGTGTLLNDLINAAGGVNVVTESGWVAYSLEQLVTEDPEVYLATLGSMSDPDDLAGRPGYAELTAVKSGRVHVLDDNLVSRPGPRVVEGVRAIAEALHPEAF
ncbi:MAG: cobalamin-binding protein [Clostridiales bacterium]|nr:cobalamin-binding protein [Clostridiales bacterium]